MRQTLTVNAGPEELATHLVDGGDVLRPHVAVVYGGSLWCPGWVTPDNTETQGT